MHHALRFLRYVPCGIRNAKSNMQTMVIQNGIYPLQLFLQDKVLKQPRTLVFQTVTVASLLYIN